MVYNTNRATSRETGETAMATKNPQAVKDTAMIIQALNQLEASYERKSNAKGVDEEEKSLYIRKAAEVAATRNRVATGELFA